MRGTTPRREQGMADPVLAEMVHATGATESRHFAAVKPVIQAYRASWVKLAPYRDGPVNSQRVTVNDPAPMTAQIKQKAKELGADMVGVCRLQPHMIDLGSEVAHEFVIACCVAEDYEKVIHGADAVEEEAMRTYAKCTEIATALAAYIRQMGYPAIAHHNGASEVQAIPIFYQVGFGELGRHGSLINEEVRRELSAGIRDHRLAAGRRSAARVRRSGLLHELQRLPAQLSGRCDPTGSCDDAWHQALADRSGEMLSLLAPARRILSSMRRCLSIHREVASGDL